ncbi:glycosyl hydrolase family 18 protein [Candidatus Chrysopegis kryptomonas]|uniref:Spore germination protein YaaH n=1 Tax=Candidatus Chryseopegocella kryptomonas TaxID=1633643 RepID=A0A0P1MW15_9BACT|nr:glycosyl hydrolase family 18 protein [Candidatus Chrysopegis kryptomonas]CUS99913.1 Spore germination protein YaaH [Candidatus Chrysopegis kryptomonas]
MRLKIFAVLIFIFSSCATLRPPFEYEPKVVIAWVVKSDSTSFLSLQKNSSLVSIVSPTWLRIDSVGNVIADIDSGLLNFALQNDLPVMPLVVNHGFRVDVAEALLSDPRTRERVADSILKFVLDGNYIGINLDFEGPFIGVRDGYTKFVELVCAKLHNYGKIVSVDVVSKTQEKFTGWAGVYDYAELGEVVDYFIIMAYDYSGRLDPPGPVAPKWWVEETIKFAISQGIKPRKIILGIPFYGRWWVGNSQGRGIYYPELQKVIAKYNLKKKWDGKAKSPYFKFKDENGVENVIYFEDERSLSEKLKLVEKYGLAGIAIWRLDGEPDEFWKIIELKLKPKGFLTN